MMWLIGQVWWALLLAAGSGAALTVALSTRRVTVERWVESPVERPGDEPVETEPAEDASPEPTASSAEAPDSPFPVLGGDRPWEEEELWSRPARVVAGTAAHGPAADEWSEAADSWREWAGDATGRVRVPDENLDDEAAAAPQGWPAPSAPEAYAPAPDESPFPFATPADAPVPRHGAEDPFPYAEPVDPFPYARPVEASGPLDFPGDFPVDFRDDRDDDREAEEIRRARELLRREREVVDPTFSQRALEAVRRPDSRHTRPQ